MRITEHIHCSGHRNISALHTSTFEITRELHLTRAGHCIIGVGADKGAADLSPSFRALMAKDGTLLTTALRCGDIRAVVQSMGGSGLSLDHPTDLVWRMSSYTCGRTIGIRSDLAAANLPRELISRLRDGGDLEVELVASRDGHPPSEE